MKAAATLSSDIGIKAACESLDIPRSGFYRMKARETAPRVEAMKRPSPPRALSPKERQGVLDILHTDRFVDKAPQEIAFIGSSIRIAFVIGQLPVGSVPGISVNQGRHFSDDVLPLGVPIVDTLVGLRPYQG